MSKKNKGEKDAVYVKLDQSIEKRKVFLTSALNTANMLKSYADAKKLAERKYELMTDLKGVYGQVKHMIEVLEKHKLPSLHVERYEAKEEKKPVVKIKKESVHDDEVLRLKAELEDIERKLKTL